MKKIRIQNDIRITWRIYRMGEEEVLEGKNVNVKLYNAYNKPAPITFTYSGNMVVVEFEGRNQETLGDYTLVLTENAGEKGMVTIDKVRCFSLVKHSIDECGCPIPSCDVETVHLASDIDIPSNGKDGKSAYEIWLDNGHDGTEEDFLNWLRGGTVVDENGILTDAKGNKWQLTPYVEPPYVVSEEYSIPSVNLSYDKIPASGGTVNPAYSYSQVKTINMSDGTKRTEVIRSGGTLAWSVPGGVVSAPATSSTAEKTIETVTLIVTLNGKEGSAVAVVKQSAYVEPLSYYIGTVNATKSTFPSADLTNLTKKSYASGAQKYVATQNCLAILAPPSLDLGALSYTSGGLTTNLEKSDLNLTHDDVEIEGKTYRVYGYRVNGVTEADPLTYDYTIKKI